MKTKKLAILGVFAASLVSAEAATISLFNTDLAGEVLAPIATSNGTAVSLGSAVIAVGTYSGAEPTSAEQALAGFTSAGTAIFNNGEGVDGYFQVSVTTPTLVGGDAFVGNPVYVVIGNSTTLETSTQFLVFKYSSPPSPSDSTFSADAPVGGPGSVVVYPTYGTVLVGSFGTNVTTGFGEFQGYIMSEVIPEPSSLALGGLGLCVLLRRKRA